MLLKLSDLIRHAPDDAAVMDAGEWELRFAAEDRGPELITPWSAPMDEVLEGIMWFRCPDCEFHPLNQRSKASSPGGSRHGCRSVRTRL